jgi:hypothetical protein
MNMDIVAKRGIDRHIVLAKMCNALLTLKILKKHVSK